MSQMLIESLLSAFSSEVESSKRRRISSSELLAFDTEKLLQSLEGFIKARTPLPFPLRRTVAVSRNLAGRELLPSNLANRATNSSFGFCKSMETLFVVHGHVKPIYCIVFDKTSCFFVTGADDGLLKVWNASSGDLVRSIRGNSSLINDLDISPCNQIIASAANDGGSFTLWRSHFPLVGVCPVAGVSDYLETSGDVVHRFYSVHLSNVTFVRFAPDDSFFSNPRILTASLDSTVRIFDLRDFDAPPIVIRHDGVVHGHFEEPRRTGLRARMPNLHAVVWLEISSDGLYLASGSEDGIVRIVGLDDLEKDPVAFKVSSTSGGVKMLAWSHSGHRITAAGTQEDKKMPPKLIVVQEEHSKAINIAFEKLRVFDFHPDFGAFFVGCLAWSADDSSVLVSFGSHVVGRRDFAVIVSLDSITGRPLWYYENVRTPPACICSCPLDPAYMMIGGCDGVIRLIKHRSGEITRCWEGFQLDQYELGRAPFQESCFSNDGNYYVIANSDGQIIVLGFNSGYRYSTMLQEQFFEKEYDDDVEWKCEGNRWELVTRDGMLVSSIGKLCNANRQPYSHSRLVNRSMYRQLNVFKSVLDRRGPTHQKTWRRERTWQLRTCFPNFSASGISSSYQVILVADQTRRRMGPPSPETVIPTPPPDEPLYCPTPSTPTTVAASDEDVEFSETNISDSSDSSDTDSTLELSSTDSEDSVGGSRHRVPKMRKRKLLVVDQATEELSDILNEEKPVAVQKKRRVTSHIKFLRNGKPKLLYFKPDAKGYSEEESKFIARQCQISRCILANAITRTFSIPQKDDRFLFIRPAYDEAVGRNRESELLFQRIHRFTKTSVPECSCVVVVYRVRVDSVVFPDVPIPIPSMPLIVLSLKTVFTEDSHVNVFMGREKMANIGVSPTDTFPFIFCLPGYYDDEGFFQRFLVPYHEFSTSLRTLNRLSGSHKDRDFVVRQEQVSDSKWLKDKRDRCIQDYPNPSVGRLSLPINPEIPPVIPMAETPATEPEPEESDSEFRNDSSSDSDRDSIEDFIAEASDKSLKARRISKLRKGTKTTADKPIPRSTSRLIEQKRTMKNSEGTPQLTVQSALTAVAPSIPREVTTPPGYIYLPLADQVVCIYSLMLGRIEEMSSVLPARWTREEKKLSHQEELEGASISKLYKSLMLGTTQLSPWDLEMKECIEEPPESLTGVQVQSLVDVLRRFISSNYVSCSLWVEDPKQYPFPMEGYSYSVSYNAYFGLLLMRLEGGYYRSIETVKNDIAQIAYNATVYNDPKSVIVSDVKQIARDLIEEIDTLWGETANWIRDFVLDLFNQSI